MKKLTLLTTILLIANLLFAQYNKIDTSFYSSSLGEEKMVDILLPPQYYTHPEEYYPVVYFLHGAGANQDDYPILYTWTQHLVQNNLIHPIILVKPDGSCPPYWGSMYANSELYGAYEDYIAYDLVTFIDNNYRTIDDRNYRCITGHSMGGGGSAKLAIKHPDIYRGFASQAGVMNFDTVQSIWYPLVKDENGGTPPYTYTWGAGTYTNFIYSGAGAWSPNLNNPPTYVDYPLDSQGNVIDSISMKWKQHDNCFLIKQISPDDNLGIFFSCGTNDDHQLYPSNELFRDTLDMLGLDYVFLTTDGDHFFTSDMIVAGYEFFDSLMFFGVGTDENVAKNSQSKILFTVAPNPVKDKIIISYELFTTEDVHIKVIDITGKELLSASQLNRQAGKHQDHFNIKSYKAGIYFCRILIGNEMVTKKIIKL